MMGKILQVVLVGTSLLAGTGVALADGDAAKGEKAFLKCKACHDIKDGVNKVGPTLKGVMGRAAGTVEGFTYSEAMKNSGITWDEDKLKAYIADPKATVPGNKMSFAGIKKEEELENLVAYLATASN